MFLIHPPVVKPTEPPPGIAKLSGVLSAKGIDHSIIDANLEGFYYLLKNISNRPVLSSMSEKGHMTLDTWTKRAIRKLTSNLEYIKDPNVYTEIDRYKRIISDLNRAISRSVDTENIRLSLVDYANKQLSPLKSHDLLFAAAHPEENPFYTYFKERIVQAVETYKGKNNMLFGFSMNFLSQALTTFAMIGAMIPLAFGSGAGHESNAPMALAIIGGLVSSTVLTLLVVPAIYKFMYPLDAWLRKWYEKGKIQH